MKNFNAMDIFLSDSPNGHVFKLTSGKIHQGFIKHFTLGASFFTLGLAKHLYNENPNIIINIVDVEEVFEV